MSNLPSRRWGLVDQIFGAYFLSATMTMLSNVIAITVCGSNPFKVSVGDNLLMMLVISPAIVCLFLVGYFMYKKIFWPWTVLAGVLLAIRMCAFHS
jgi:membrane protein DedA with SNARE-associated domain